MRGVGEIWKYMVLNQSINFGGILIVLKIPIVCDHFQGQLRSSL